MKKLIFFLIFCWPVLTTAQDDWGLKTIIAAAYDAPSHTAERSVKPLVLKKLPTGGEMEVELKTKIGGNRYCTSRYLFQWRFSRPLTQLRTGEAFDVHYEVQVMHGPCRNADIKMTVSASAGFSNAYRRLDLRQGPGGISFTGFLHPNHRYVYAVKFVRQNTGYAKVVPWGGNYAAIRLNFESQAPVGSERMHYEVVYVFEKGLSAIPPSTAATPTSCDGPDAWYNEVESSHPWRGLSMHQIRERGYREAFYYGSMTWGWNYFLRDPNGRNVRVFGNRIYYVDWACFEQHYSYVRRDPLTNYNNLSHKDRWRRNKDGFEFDIVYVAH